MIRIIHIVIFLCFYCTTNIAQLGKDWSIGLSGNYGYILPHYSFIYNKVESPVTSLEINLTKQSTGKNGWQELYNYPVNGFSLFYSTLGNDDVFGREIALSYFVKLYPKFSKKRHFYQRIGVGMSHNKGKFNAVSNPFNVAIGSTFNVHFSCRIGFEAKLSEKLSIETGLAFNHFSNGNISEPNLGLNYATGFLGLSYNITEKSEKKTFEAIKGTDSHLFYAYLSAGAKRSRGQFEPPTITSSFSFEYLHKTFTKWHFGGGLDLFFDPAVSYENELKGRPVSPIDDFHTAVHISQAIIYNELQFIVQEGIYVGLPNEIAEKNFFFRIMVARNLTERLALRVSLKTHLFIADYPELSIGYRF